MTDQVFFNDIWTLHFHDPYDTNWASTSYHTIGTISTMQEFLEIHHVFADLWAKGMFFLMREHIQPIWEDDHNVNGGCFSFKVMKPEVPQAWFDLCGRCVGENISPQIDIDWSRICGVSISPKRNYCILRVWVSDAQWAAEHNQKLQLLVPTYSSVQFKAHNDPRDA